MKENEMVKEVTRCKEHWKEAAPLQRPLKKQRNTKKLCVKECNGRKTERRNKKHTHNSIKTQERLGTGVCAI